VDKSERKPSRQDAPLICPLALHPSGTDIELCELNYKACLKMSGSNCDIYNDYLKYENEANFSDYDPNGPAGDG